MFLTVPSSSKQILRYQHLLKEAHLLKCMYWRLFLRTAGIT